MKWLIGAGVALGIYAGWFWFTGTSPELHSSDGAASPGVRSLAELGQFGDAFGAINALFAGVTVGLVWATFVLQRRELKQVSEHFAEARRMETLKLLLEGFDSAVAHARSGSAQGSELLEWVSKEVKEPLVNGSFKEDKGLAWKELMQSEIPNLVPLSGVAECFRAMSGCVGAATSSQERMTMMALIRGRVLPSIGPGLITACAAHFQGDREALAAMDFVFGRLNHDFDEVYMRMRLVHVVGKRPPGMYGTHYLDTLN